MIVFLTFFVLTRRWLRFFATYYSKMGKVGWFENLLGVEVEDLSSNVSFLANSQCLEEKDFLETAVVTAVVFAVVVVVDVVVVVVVVDYQMS